MNTVSFTALRIIGVPLCTIVLYYGIYSVYPQALENYIVRLGGINWLWLDILINIAASIILSESSIVFYHYLDKKIPWEINAMRRAWIQFPLLTLFTAILIFLILGFYWLILGQPFQADELYASLATGIIISLLMNGTYTGIFLFGKWKKSLIENEILQKEAAQIRLALLRQQIAPHFLFNSLNVLAGLIEEDTKAASEFVMNLSRLYRYALNVADSSLTPLRQEIQAAQAYLSLVQARFNNGFTIDFLIPQHLDEYLIPPLTLQILIENIFKHNKISSENPLHITIRCDLDRECISVKNTVNPIDAGGLGKGLAIIESRYQAFKIQNALSLHSSREEFEAIVPLLNRKRHHLETIAQESTQ
jgi:LytS/YehU family sensor histidine kinase